MIPSKLQINNLLAKYAPNDEYLELIKTHGEVVAEIALWCASNTSEDVNLKLLEATCLLHDIGSYAFIGCSKL